MSDRAPRCPFCGEDASTQSQQQLQREPAKAGGTTQTSLFDHATVAQEAVETLGAEGLKLDYSVASLAAVDQWLSDRDGEYGAGLDDTWRPTATDKRWIARIGSYAGEVIRLRFGGNWADDAAHPGMPLFLRVEFDRGGAFCPLDATYRRLKNGESDGLAKLADKLRAQLGEEGYRAEDGMDWANQATDYIRNERYDLALEFLKRAVLVDPSLCEGWFCRGFVEEKLSRHHDALRSYDSALRFAPGDDKAFSQHVKQQIQRLNAELGGFRPNSGESPVFRPSGERETAGDDRSGDFQARQPSDSAEAISSGAEVKITTESSVLRKIRENRQAEADTAVPGGIRPPDPSELPAARSSLALSLDDGPTHDAAPTDGTLPFLDTAKPEINPNTLAWVSEPPDLGDADSSFSLDAESSLSLDEDAGESGLGRSQPPMAASAALEQSQELLGVLRFDEAGAALASISLEALRGPEERVTYASIQLVLGRPEAAIAALRHVVETTPKLEAGHEMLVLAMLADERYDDALDAAGRALGRHPDAAWAWEARGKALYLLEQFSDAAKALARAVSLAPTRRSAWRLRGLALLDSGRVDDAKAALTVFVTLDDGTDPSAARAVKREIAKLS